MARPRAAGAGLGPGPPAAGGNAAGSEAGWERERGSPRSVAVPGVEASLGCSFVVVVTSTFSSTLQTRGEARRNTWLVCDTQGLLKFGFPGILLSEIMRKWRRIITNLPGFFFIWRRKLEVV